MIHTIFSLLFLCGVKGESFYNESAKGWHWYEDPLLRPKEETKPTAKDPTALMTLYKKHMESLLNKAILSPTQENVKRYQFAQKELMERSHYFAKIWRDVVLDHPDLDYSRTFPITQKARHIYIDNEKKTILEAIKKFQKEWGLFFFFSKDCAYCVQFSPIVKEFSKIYKFEVIAISKDGSPLPEFPRPKKDPGIFDAWGLDIYPALFAVNPKTEEIIPVSFGFKSLEDIEDNVTRIAQRVFKNESK